MHQAKEERLESILFIAQAADANTGISQRFEHIIQNRTLGYIDFDFVVITKSYGKTQYLLRLGRGIHVHDKGLHHRAAEQFTHRALLNNVPVIDYGYIPAQGFRLLQVVRRQDDGGAVLAIDTRSGTPTWCDEFQCPHRLWVHRESAAWVRAPEARAIIKRRFIPPDRFLDGDLRLSHKSSCFR